MPNSGQQAPLRQEKIPRKRCERVKLEIFVNGALGKGKVQDN